LFFGQQKYYVFKPLSRCTWSYAYGQGKKAVNFIEDIQAAKYYAFMKNYRKKGVVLRTKFAPDKFEASKRFPQSWRMLLDFPVSDLEALDGNAWVPLEKYEPFSTLR